MEEKVRDKTLPIYSLDLGCIPFNMTVKDYLDLFKKEGLSLNDGMKIINPHYILSNGNVKMKVSQDVIDFLDIHNVESHEDGTKYFIVNDIKYKFEGLYDGREEVN